MSTGRSNLIERLTERGYRLTPQRELLLSELGRTHKHLDAETLLAKVRKVYPRVNKSVVYRNLELLVSLGLISCVDFGQGRVEYEVHRHPHHHHLVCRGCHRIAEVHVDAFSLLQQQLHELYGFSADLDHLAIFGLCQACQGKAPGQAGHHPHTL